MNNVDLLSEGFSEINYGNLEKILSSFSVLTATGKEKYARALNYLLTISEKFNEQELQNNYALIGGFSILGYLVDTIKDDNVVLSWRGSDDLDIISNSYDVLSVFKGFDFFYHKRSHLGNNKYSISIADTVELIRKFNNLPKSDMTDNYLKIDLYLPQDKDHRNFSYSRLSTNFWKKLRQVSIFDHDITVADPFDLLKLKLSVNSKFDGLPRSKDKLDIYVLLGICEKNKIPIKKIYNQLNEIQQKKLSYLSKLYINLKIYKNGVEGVPKIILPSADYIISYVDYYNKMDYHPFNI